MIRTKFVGTCNEGEIILNDDDTTIGFLEFERKPHPQHGTMKIKHVNIVPEHRGKNLSKRLYSEACKTAKRCNAELIIGSIKDIRAFRSRIAIFGTPIKIQEIREDIIGYPEIGDEVSLKYAEKILSEGGTEANFEVTNSVKKCKMKL